MTGKPSVTVTFKNKAQFNKELNKFGDQIKNVVHDIMDVAFNDMVNYAKANAVWIDRTGNARRSIAAEDLSSKDVVLFYLTIGVDYGIWLEVANDGKYRILQPTMTIYEKKIMDLLARVGVELKNQGTFTTSVMRQG